MCMHYHQFKGVPSMLVLSTLDSKIMLITMAEKGIGSPKKKKPFEDVLFMS